HLLCFSLYIHLFFLMCLMWSSSFFFFSSRRRHTRSKRDWSSDVCSSDLIRIRRNDVDGNITESQFFLDFAADNHTDAKTNSIGDDVLDMIEIFQNKAKS